MGTPHWRSTAIQEEFTIQNAILKKELWELPASARHRSKKNSQFRILFCEKNCGNSFVPCRKTENTILLSLSSNQRRISPS
ncbi:hypothetical protein DLM75_12525 [Leptospira stimsonii]|uniref:Uncharacterized protein n=1 Tax=Leptospira stimsonii TaxID=2202203 RepID=A0A396Z2Q7_9LEPT|nr:hypothetical protein DLM75_12525 [Leptospira stimsonii]